MTRISRALLAERFTCGMAGWCSNDRPAGTAQSDLPAVAIGADVLWLRRRCSGDDRVAVGRAGAADAGAPGKAGWRRDNHRGARRTRYRGGEEWRHRRGFFFFLP